MARKSVAKRIRVTKNGKMMRRKMSQGHCRAKKSGKQLHRKRVPQALQAMDAKVFFRYLTTKN